MATMANAFAAMLLPAHPFTRQIGIVGVMRGELDEAGTPAHALRQPAPPRMRFTLANIAVNRHDALAVAAYSGR